MKKKYLFIISCVIIISLAFSLIVIYLQKTSNEKNYIQDIQNDYNQIVEKIEEEKIEPDNLAKDYAQLFERISNGNAEKAEDYARLVTEITKGTIEVDKDEVFSLSENLAAFYEKMADGFNDFGVQNIKIVEDNSGKRSLCIEYIAINSYSVRILDEDERLFNGEFPDVREEPAALMGEYRIEISFSDTRAASELSKKYGDGKIHEFEEVPDSLESKLKIRIGYFGDSTFIIYIGSDEPINIKEHDFIKANRPMGNIEIAIEE